MGGSPRVVRARHVALSRRKRSVLLLLLAGAVGSSAAQLTQGCLLPMRSLAIPRVVVASRLPTAAGGPLVRCSCSLMWMQWERCGGRRWAGTHAAAAGFVSDETSWTLLYGCCICSSALEPTPEACWACGRRRCRQLVLERFAQSKPVGWCCTYMWEGGMLFALVAHMPGCVWQGVCSHAHAIGTAFWLVESRLAT